MPLDTRSLHGHLFEPLEKNARSAPASIMWQKLEKITSMYVNTFFFLFSEYGGSRKWYILKKT